MVAAKKCSRCNAPLSLVDRLKGRYCRACRTTSLAKRQQRQQRIEIPGSLASSPPSPRTVHVESAAAVSGESSLQELFEAIIAAENRGETIDRDAIVEQHPQYREQLEGFFAHHDLQRGSNVCDDRDQGNGHRHPVAVGQRSDNVNGAVGLFFAIVGVLGWFLTVSVIQDIEYLPKTGDGQRDLKIGFRNLLVFLLRSVTGLIGSIIFGGSCVMGLTISALGLAKQPKWPAWAGVIVGLVGIAIWMWNIGERISRYL